MTLLEKALRAIDSLPPVPAAILRLAKLVGTPFPEVGRVAAIVQSDPALSAAILRSANSAGVGATVPVGDVHRAIAQIGTRAAIEVAMSAAFAGYLPKRLPGYDIPREAYVEHCVTVGGLARSICELVHLRTTADPFMCGLLHDGGKLVLCHFIALKRAQVRLLDTTGSRWADAERALLGTDHTVLGEALARAWRLPDACRATARWHHAPWDAPPSDAPELCAVIHIANEHAHRLAGEEREPSVHAAALLSLDEGQLDDVLAEATRRRSLESSSAA